MEKEKRLGQPDPPIGLARLPRLLVACGPHHADSQRTADCGKKNKATILLANVST